MSTTALSDCRVSVSLFLEGGGKAPCFAEGGARGGSPSGRGGGGAGRRECLLRQGGGCWLVLLRVEERRKAPISAAVGERVLLGVLLRGE